MIKQVFSLLEPNLWNFSCTKSNLNTLKIISECLLALSRPCKERPSRSKKCSILVSFLSFHNLFKLSLGDVECWDFRYSVKNSLGFLLVHNFSEPKLYFFNFEVGTFQPRTIVPALKSFGKKLQPINLTNKNVLKMTPGEDAIVIKINSDELALYKNLDEFLHTRQAYKYADIPVSIKDFEVFEMMSYGE